MREDERERERELMEPTVTLLDDEEELELDNRRSLLRELPELDRGRLRTTEYVLLFG